jgi:hypothetical protein
MSKRNLLHKSKLDDFKSWLDSQGIQHRAGKGGYQVIQVMTNKGWQVVFDKHSDEHFTVNEVLVPMVVKFIRETKVNPTYENPKVDHAENRMVSKVAVMPHTDEFDEVFKTLKELLDVADVPAIHWDVENNAKKVIAKFDRVG